MQKNGEVHEMTFCGGNIVDGMVGFRVNSVVIICDYQLFKNSGENTNLT
jgi:hypothetical protein